MATPVTVTVFSDVLCVWAYVGQARIEEVKARFGDDVRIDYRFFSVFGDARSKIATTWRDRGGAEGYRDHVLGIARRFPHVAVHPDIWVATQPASSASPHLFLAALRDQDGNAFERVLWDFRRAFFDEGRDIGRRDVQDAIAARAGVDLAAIDAAIQSGTAFARLEGDLQEAARLRIEGSPTIVLNEGRQKLYGNVGFRVIEANIAELLRDPRPGEASWC